MSQNPGILYLIPCTLGSESIDMIPEQTARVVEGVDFFVVERLRSARRYIRQISKSKPIDDLTFIELDKRSDNQEQVKSAIAWLISGKDVGILSEAGAPCIADPGNLVVKAAHKEGIKVTPLTGPSSIFLALMASGMNGQNFAFNGYLPVKKEQLPKAIAQMESIAKKKKQTQLFMETPYRNEQVWKVVLSTLENTTRLGYAVDLTLPTEEIRVKQVAEWKRLDVPNLHKRPCMFMLL